MAEDRRYPVTWTPVTDRMIREIVNEYVTIGPDGLPVDDPEADARHAAFEWAVVDFFRWHAEPEGLDPGSMALFDRLRDHMEAVREAVIDGTIGLDERGNPTVFGTVDI